MSNLSENCWTSASTAAHVCVCIVHRSTHRIEQQGHVQNGSGSGTRVAVGEDILPAHG